MSERHVKHDLRHRRIISVSRKETSPADDNGEEGSLRRLLKCRGCSIDTTLHGQSISFYLLGSSVLKVPRADASRQCEHSVMLQTSLKWCTTSIFRKSFPGKREIPFSSQRRYWLMKSPSDDVFDIDGVWGWLLEVPGKVVCMCV